MVLVPDFIQRIPPQVLACCSFSWLRHGCSSGFAPLCHCKSRITFLLCWMRNRKSYYQSVRLAALNHALTVEMLSFDSSRAGFQSLLWVRLVSLSAVASCPCSIVEFVLFPLHLLRPKCKMLTRRAAYHEHGCFVHLPVAVFHCCGLAAFLLG